MEEQKGKQRGYGWETLEDQRLLRSYLPLLREFIPSAVEEIESDLQSYKVGEDDYVYDYYTVMEVDMTAVDASSPFPLVQVDEGEYCDGPDDSDYESDDSNAENNPRNDYPDETSEDKEVESEASDDESEEESVGDGSSESEDVENRLPEDANLLYEDDVYDFNDYEGEDDDFVYDDDHGGGCYRED